MWIWCFSLLLWIRLKLMENLNEWNLSSSSFLGVFFPDKTKECLQSLKSGIHMGRKVDNCNHCVSCLMSLFWHNGVKLLDVGNYTSVCSSGAPSRVKHCHPEGEVWYFLREYSHILWLSLLIYIMTWWPRFRLVSVTHSGTAAVVWNSGSQLG